MLIAASLSQQDLLRQQCFTPQGDQALGVKIFRVE
jgi:hypothetical protein